MTQQEYDELLNKIRTETQEKEKNLARQFAMSNNTVKVGDIVSDYAGRVKVTKVKFTMVGARNYPECVYEGNELNKDGTIKMTRGRKSQPEIRGVYQSRMIV